MAQSDGALVIPVWFMRIAAGLGGLFVAMFVPWAAWMSVQVIQLTTRMDSVPELARRVTVIEGTTIEHDRAIKRLQRARVVKP